MKIHNDIEQGSDEWLALRSGMLTASTCKNIMSPKQLKPSNNDKTRAFAYELAAQRINNYVEPTFCSAAMENGNFGEPIARDIYSKHYAEAVEVGFITREIQDMIGFANPAQKGVEFESMTLGYSPDGLVGDVGLIEIKTRCQKLQLKAIALDEMPADVMLQVQFGMLVAGRGWCDYVSYCGGMPLYVKRIPRDEAIHEAIIEAATVFEDSICALIADYSANLSRGEYPATERIEFEQNELIIGSK